MLAEQCKRGILSHMEEKYIHESHGVHHILYHIIFCTKRRKKVLDGAIHDQLKQIIEQVVEENAWQIERLAIQPDHVHLFIQSNPYTLPTDIARLIKGRSSHDLREAFPELNKLPSLWTRSTFYSTAGHVSQETMNKYIEKQSKQ
jgi:putative transposase